MKKKLLIITMIMSLILFSGCSSNDETVDDEVIETENSETDTISENTISEDSLPMRADIGKDNDGNDIVRITITLTNTADYYISAYTDSSSNFYQNGEELKAVETADKMPEDFYMVDGRNLWHSYDEMIKPGDTIDICRFYYLINTEDPIEAEFHSYISFDDYTETIKLN